MTFKLCKRIIENTKEKKDLDEAFKEDMKEKLDVFLLNNRITEEEYNLLTAMMEN